MKYAIYTNIEHLHIKSCVYERPHCPVIIDCVVVSTDPLWYYFRRGRCGKTEVCETDEIPFAAREQAKNIRHVSWDTKFANNFMISR